VASPAAAKVEDPVTRADGQPPKVDGQHDPGPLLLFLLAKVAPARTGKAAIASR
jgi:hypothetical protein